MFLLCSSLANVLQNHLLQQFHLDWPISVFDAFSIISVQHCSLSSSEDNGGAASYSSRMSAFIECGNGGGGGAVHSLAFASKPLGQIYMHNLLALGHASVKYLASKYVSGAFFFLHTSDLGLRLLFTTKCRCLWLVGVLVFVLKLCSECVNTFTLQTLNTNFAYMR